MKYTDQGSGPPVLMLHGNPDTRALWDSVIERCAGERRCLAPDLPGFGNEPVPQGFDFSLDSMAHHVDRFIERVDPNAPVTLAVHDFGGVYGLAWAVRNPHKVRAILVTNTIFSSDYRWHFWARIWRTPLLGELSMRLMNRQLFVREIRRGSVRLSQHQIDAMYTHRNRAMEKAVLEMYRATDPENFTGWQEDLASLAANVPVRVLWGRRDPYIDSRFASRFGTRDIRILGNVGHWVPSEAPQDVADALLTLP